MAIIQVPFLFGPSTSGHVIENAIMLDGSADYLSWTPFAAGTEETWTFSFWVKKSEFGSEMGLFEVQVNTSNRLGITLRQLLQQIR